MNANSLKQAKLFKSGLKQKSNNVVIGGADLSDLASKEAILEEKVLEARGSAEKQCQEIFEEAQKQADELVAEAERRVEEIENAAYQKGFAEGVEQGLLQTTEQYAETLDMAKKVLDAIEQERLETLAHEEERIYNILVLICQKLLKKNYELNPKLSMEFITASINKLEQKSSVNIFVHPDVAAELIKLKSEISQSVPGLEAITITSENKLEPGDLILESNRERLDFRLDTQLDELLKEILKK